MTHSCGTSLLNYRIHVLHYDRIFKGNSRVKTKLTGLSVMNIDHTIHK